MSKSKRKKNIARTVIKKIGSDKAEIISNELFDYDFSEVRVYTAVIIKKNGDQLRNVFSFPNEHESKGTAETFFNYVTNAVFPFVIEHSGITLKTMKSFIVTDGDGVKLPGTIEVK